MKNLITTITLFLLAFPAPAALKLTVAVGSEQLGEPAGRAGWTLVAMGNSKGQTFTTKKAGLLGGIIVSLSNADPADLTLSLFKTKNGFPDGDPLHSDTGALPKGIADVSLKIEFASPPKLKPGNYALMHFVREIQSPLSPEWWLRGWSRHPQEQEFEGALDPCRQPRK